MENVNFNYNNYILYNRGIDIPYLFKEFDYYDIKLINSIIARELINFKNFIDTGKQYIIQMKYNVHMLCTIARFLNSSHIANLTF